jgi:hypothetical protein
VALLTHAAGQDAPRITIRIVDDRTGHPLAASVVLTDAQGKAIEIDGSHDHVRYLQKRWCYVDGQAAVAPSAGGDLSIEIRRGPETLPVKATLSKSDAQTLRLKRWIDMTDSGYLSGDTHVHYLTAAQSHLQMRAEDLAVLNLLTSDFTNDVQKFTGRLDPVSTPGHWVYVGQEFRDWQQGHINLLRLRKIVEPLGPFGGTFRSTSNRHLLLKPAAEEARKQDAVITWAHFGDMPGAESPIDIGMGLIDAVDLITQMDPLRVGLHWEPWKMEQPAHLPKLAALPGIELYYQYLNAGFRLPMASGTDKMGDDIPVGSSRIYVKTGANRSFDAWLTGLKAGNSFITNGPLLTFEADGRSSGDQVDVRRPRTVTARATARSIHPFSRLQVMMNGKAVASSGEPRRNADGIYFVELQTQITLDRSAWLAARVAEPSLEGKGFMPRRMTVFAHTNPVWFLRDGAKVRVQESIDHLILYLRYAEHWFESGARFESEAVKQQALAAAREALAIYRKL